MKTINERRAPADIQLSGVQKYVLAKLIASETPSTAYGEVTRGANVVAATQQFTKEGLMTVDENKAEAYITDQGREALQKEALIDETGQLTEEGEMFAYATSAEEAMKADYAVKGKPEAPALAAPPPETPGAGMPTDSTAAATQASGEADAFSIESIEMIRGFQEVLKEQKFLKKTKS